MKEEIKIIDGTFKKDDPHKDIGKQKFRVRRAYTTWVEYDVVADSKEEAEDAVREHGGIDKIEWQEGYHNDEPVEVYATDWNSDHSINPMTARKNVFGKARVKGVKAKDFVKQQIEKMYNTKKWCKKTTRGNWDKRNIDMYDGLVMSLFEKKA